MGSGYLESCEKFLVVYILKDECALRRQICYGNKDGAC